MANIKIPIEFGEALSEYSKLNEEKLKIMNKIFDEYVIPDSFETIKEKITKVIGFDVNTANNIVEFILLIIKIQQTYGYEKSELISRILEVFKQEEWHSFKIGKKFGKKFGETYSSAKNLKILLKSKHLEYLREKAIISCRIITDIRPVFDEPEENEEMGTIIIHNLIINYVENNKQKEVHYALDKNDLYQLERTIKKALRKEDIIRQNFSQKKLNIIETELI